MDNFKIDCKDEKEKSEAIRLLVDLGYRDHETKDNYLKILAYGDGDIQSYCSFETFSHHKELTIPKLRDLVVLKRNDVGDATHTDHNKFKYYIGNESYLKTTDGWTKVTLDHSLIKPIEKEMKEFLVKHNDTWALQLLDSDTEENSFRVAVPEWANYAYNNDLGICFLKSEIGFNHPLLLWQRHTKPEANNAEDSCDKDDIYSHYKKDISHLKVLDVYRVLELFDVTNPCLQHAVKKLLCSGQRGIKDSDRDINEAIDSLRRYNEMRVEDENK